MTYPKTVTVETDDSIAEAIKDAQGDYWVIGYPWGGDKFYGSSPEVRSRMKKALARYEKTEACENVGNHRDGWTCSKCGGGQ